MANRMDSMNLAVASNAVLEKILASETLSRTNGSTYTTKEGVVDAEYKCMRPPALSLVKEQPPPSLQNPSHSGLSHLSASNVDASKSFMVPPSANKGNRANQNQGYSTNHMGGAVKVMKHQETDPNYHTEWSVEVETETKCRWGRGSRGGIAR
eukprot:c53619_g1_i1 orf=189-647(+)